MTGNYARFTDVSSADAEDVVALGSEQGPDGYHGPPTVGVWSTADGSLVARMSDPEYSIGDRLAISASGKLLACSSWSGGLTMHEVSTGRRLWHVRKLNHCMGLVFSLADDELFLIRVTAAPSYRALAIEAHAGERMRSLGACDHVSVFPRSETWLRWTRENNAVLLTSDEVELWRTATATFKCIESASSPGVIVLSEAKIGLRAFSVKSGKMIWHVKFAESIHVSKMSYVENLGQFACWTFGGPKGSNRLLLVDSLTGAIVSERDTGSLSIIGFCRRGELFVDSKGSAWGTRTGEKMFEFQWPI